MLCHLWSNNVLFNSKNLIYPGDKVGPNPHLMSISMIPLHGFNVFGGAIAIYLH